MDVPNTLVQMVVGGEFQKNMDFSAIVLEAI